MSQVSENILKQVDSNPVPSQSEINSASLDNRADYFKEEEVYAYIDSYFKQKFMKSSEFIISCLILIFAVSVIGLFVVLFWTGKIRQELIYKMTILSLIIFSTLFLISTGYSNDQIAPAIGLMGTIAGYLLGKSYSTDESKNSNGSK